jgi:hypothetical protein
MKEKAIIILVGFFSLVFFGVARAADPICSSSLACTQTNSEGKYCRKMDGGDWQWVNAIDCSFDNFCRTYECAGDKGYCGVNSSGVYSWINSGSATCPYSISVTRDFLPGGDTVYNLTSSCATSDVNCDKGDARVKVEGGLYPNEVAKKMKFKNSEDMLTSSSYTLSGSQYEYRWGTNDDITINKETCKIGGDAAPGNYSNYYNVGNLESNMDEFSIVCECPAIECNFDNFCKTYECAGEKGYCGVNSSGVYSWINSGSATCPYSISVTRDFLPGGDTAYDLTSSCVTSNTGCDEADVHVKVSGGTEPDEVAKKMRFSGSGPGGTFNDPMSTSKSFVLSGSEYEYNWNGADNLIINEQACTVFPSGNYAHNYYVGELKSITDNFSVDCTVPIISYSCTNIPANATLCTNDNSGLTVNTASSLVTACSLPAGSGSIPKCEYYCNSGYVKSGSTCVAVSSDGSCGTAAQTYAYDATGFSGSFCTSGTVNPAIPVFPAIGSSTSWTCGGSNGGMSVSCLASRNRVNTKPEAKFIWPENLATVNLYTSSQKFEGTGESPAGTQCAKVTGYQWVLNYTNGIVLTGINPATIDFKNLTPYQHFNDVDYFLIYLNIKCEITGSEWSINHPYVILKVWNYDNKPPTAEITNPSEIGDIDKTINSGESITFTGNGTDSDGTIAGYQWTQDSCNGTTALGDASTTATTTATFQNTTDQSISKNIFFKVKDDIGAWSDCASRIINIASAGNCTLDCSDEANYCNGEKFNTGKCGEKYCTGTKSPTSYCTQNTGVPCVPTPNTKICDCMTDCIQDCPATPPSGLCNSGNWIEVAP